MYLMLLTTWMTEMIAEVETEVYPEIAAEGRYESTVTETTLAEAPPPRSRVKLYVIGLVALVVVAIWAWWYLYSLGYESTDDAQVDGHLNPIAARIDGTIKAVHVDDNQSVQAGALLIELDPSDDEVALHRKGEYDEAVAELWGFASVTLPIMLIEQPQTI